MPRSRNHFVSLCRALHADPFELAINQNGRHGLQPQLKPDGHARGAINSVHEKRNVVLGRRALPHCLRLPACIAPRGNNEFQLCHGLSAARWMGKRMAHIDGSGIVMP